MPCEVGRVRRQRDDDRQPRENRLHDAEARVRVRHPYVDVQPADALAPRRRARVGDEVLIALRRRDRLRGGDARRIRARGGDPQAAARSCVHRDGPQLGKPRDCIVGRFGDVCRKLDDARMQLCLQQAR